MEPLPPRNPRRIIDIRQDPLKCQNPYKPPHDIEQGGKRFCSQVCREMATENARSALARCRAYLEPTRRKFLATSLALSGSLGTFLDSLPTARTARQEALSGQLDELDERMATVGPVDLETRSEIRAKAAAVVAVTARSRDSIDQSLAVRAHELLRDVGAEGADKAEIARQLLPHAHFAVDYFERTGDYVNLGRALLALGNIYRLASRNREAGKFFRWAFWIVRELLYGHEFRDRYTASIIHQARFWWLRTNGANISARNEIKSELGYLGELAAFVDSPAVWVEHYRELAGFHQMLLSSASSAEESLGDLARERGALAGCTAYAEPTLLTPEIMLLMETGRGRKATELIRGPYCSSYLDHRHVYYYDQLQKWRRFCSLPQLARPEYGSAFFAYLPRYQPERTPL